MTFTRITAVILATTMLLASPVLRSATVDVPAGTTISSIRVFADYAIVIFSPAVPNSLCPGPAKNAGIIDWSGEGGEVYRVIYNTAMAAQLLNKKVRLGLVDSCHPWNLGTPRIWRIEFAD